MEKELKQILTRHLKNKENDYTYQVGIDTIRAMIRHNIIINSEKNMLSIAGKTYKIIKNYASRKVEGFYKIVSIKFLAI